MRLAALATIAAVNVAQVFRRPIVAVATPVTSAPPPVHPAFEEPECECPVTTLCGDLVQEPNGWVWRIYDAGCNGETRQYVHGVSESLGEAQDDIVETMVDLCQQHGYELEQPEFSVMHHVCAAVAP